MNDAASSCVQRLFAEETRGDPLAAFPSLTRSGKAYNMGLTEQVLDPLLAGWLSLRDNGRESAGAIAANLAWGSARARAAFREILPAAAAAGDPAVLAAMGVTANLQRTLGILAEHVAGGGLIAAASPEAPIPFFRLSRFWCGIVEYPDESPYFTARVRPPVHPARLQPGRRDPRHLANSLWCSLAAVNERCDEAIAVLREEIIRSGIYAPADIERFRPPSPNPHPRN